MTIDKAPYMKVSEKVLEILEEEIMAGNFRPGDRLVEREIAARLGVSRVPVREALFALEKRGLVKKKRANDKWREIVALTPRELSESYHVKYLIECHAFSEKSLDGDESLLGTLENLITDMDLALKKSDVGNYREININFHNQIVFSLENKRLNDIYLDVSRMLRWFQTITLFVPRMEKSNSEHRLMLEAYKERDLGEIRRIFKLHHEQAVEFLAKNAQGLRSE
ncbi:MAG: GntR family transcriptional regulator [Desulfarculaceae bacterium]|jgi:DNA-binding GntR family transcriptional regulator